MALSCKLRLARISAELRFQDRAECGKIPTGAEATKYKIDKGQLDWLPTVDSLPWFGSFISKHGATASAMDPSSQDSTSKGT